METTNPGPVHRQINGHYLSNSAKKHCEKQNGQVGAPPTIPLYMISLVCKNKQHTRTENIRVQNVTVVKEKYKVYIHKKKKKEEKNTAKNKVGVE